VLLLSTSEILMPEQQGTKNPRHQNSEVTDLYMGARSLCGSSVQNMLHVNLLAPRILG
jgi:hypothetical protein